MNSKEGLNLNKEIIDQYNLGEIGEITEDGNREISLPDIEDLILVNLKRIGVQINGMSKETLDAIRPTLPLLQDLFRNITHFINYSNEEINRNLDDYVLDENRLLTVNQDSRGIYLNLGFDTQQSVKDKLLEIRNKINQLDLQFSIGEITEIEFSMFREIYISKLIKLISISIS